MDDTTPDPTTAPCVVNQRYYPHMFLIPAAIIITILAFLRRRSSFKKDVWGGRPGLVVPIDFLGIDHDRLAIVFVFGAATASIVSLIATKHEGRNVWETAFLGIGFALEIAFLYYPYFACLASYHRIIGALMGLPYTSIMLALSTAVVLQRCNGDTTTWQGVVFLYLLPQAPAIICHLCILGKFLIVLYEEIKEYGIFGIQIFNHRNEDLSMQVNLTRPWLINHVKDLVNTRPPRQYSRMEFYLRKIYSREENFKFSTQTLSVVMICCILCYRITFLIVFVASGFLDLINDADSENIAVKIVRGFYGALLAAAILAAIFCIVSIIRFMENHKNNMLRMFKGDKSFIPQNISVTQFMIGKGLRYHSYQIGYFLWGYALLVLLFFLICSGLFSLSLPVVQGYIVKFLKGGGVVASVAVLAGLTLPMAALTIFRDYNYSKDVISINNRNVYLIFSYFWFFVGLPMGFFSAISRILKAMAVGALMLPRIDKSVMPDGFQQIDQGFIAYVCYLHVQTAFRNPILRVFCQILHDETRKKQGHKWVCSPQARARWFLGLTLARNPKLASERKPDIEADTSLLGHGCKHDDVKIEINQYSSDNAGLIQDK